MNDREEAAVLALGAAWNAMLACGAANAEAAAHIHDLQHAVMARATARSRPDLFRQPVPAPDTSAACLQLHITKGD